MIDLALPQALPISIPHRKTIRTWLLPVSERNTVHALLLSALDFGLFGAMTALTVWAPYLALKLLFGV
ncbi:MAG: hypothetical protein M0P19_14160, partial [Nevskia sp.]|nr:hypothetical protein [Nevskia sp.]